MVRFIGNGLSITGSFFSFERRPIVAQGTKKKTVSKKDKAIACSKAHPTWGAKKIADKVGCASTYVHNLISRGHLAKTEETGIGSYRPTKKVVKKAARRKTAAVAKKAKRPAYGGPLSVNELVEARRVVDKVFGGNVNDAINAAEILEAPQAQVLREDPERFGRACTAVADIRATDD
jgi:hypothetical protein